MNKKSRSRKKSKKSKQEKNCKNQPAKSLSVNAETKTNDIINDHENTLEILFPRNFIVTYNNEQVCLLCDCVAIPDIDTHCNDEVHKQFFYLYLKKIERSGVQSASDILKVTNDWKIKRISELEGTNTKIETFEILYSKNNEENIKIKLKDFHWVGIDVSFEKDMAYCKKCDIFIKLDFEAMFQHLYQHKDMYDSNSDNCERVVAHKNCIHIVEGRRNGGRVDTVDMHMNKDVDGKTVQISRIGTFYVSNIIKIVTTISTYTIINDEYCIHEYSLLVLTRNKTGDIRCEMCLKTFKAGEEESHKRSHLNDIRKLTVLTEIKYRVFEKQKEFVRQVRPYVFHCGFCNKVEAGWNKMIQHSNHYEHYEAKVSSYYRLQQIKHSIESTRCNEKNLP